MRTAVAEFVGFDALDALAPEWADLCARAEPNPFANPRFLLPLLAYERPRRLAFVLVKAAGRLIGLAALVLPRIGLARVWMSAYAALPALAIDREAGAQAVAAIAKLIGERTRLVGIVWPFVERGSAFEAALRPVGLPLVSAGGCRRAALRLAGAAAFEESLDPKRKARWARQARRLAENGKLEMQPGTKGIEAFLAVERTGWKGARGTALADDPTRLAFARAALSAFDLAGELDALTMTLDGAPIAAGLMLRAGDRAFYWKSAYDEAYAKTSPGVQLALAHSRRLAASSGLSLVDSCAVEDHPMIGRVWSDALMFEDWALGLTAGGERSLAIWLALRQAKARMRETAKRWLYRALGRKKS